MERSPVWVLFPIIYLHTIWTIVYVQLVPRILVSTVQVNKSNNTSKSQLCILREKFIVGKLPEWSLLDISSQEQTPGKLPERQV